MGETHTIEKLLVFSDYAESLYITPFECIKCHGKFYCMPSEGGLVEIHPKDFICYECLEKEESGQL